MYSLRKLVWAAFLVVGVLLVVIILLGGRQYMLSGQYSRVIEQSERVIFHFAAIRESVTEALIENNPGRLESVLPELEQLNSELGRLQENSLIPTEFKLALADKVDIAGIVLSIRRIINNADQVKESRELHERLRSIGDNLLQYDRIIVSQSRSRILNFQLVIIGSMGVIISLASFSLILLYRNTVLPLLQISSQLQSPDGITGELVIGPDVSREVADLADNIRMLMNKLQHAGQGGEGTISEGQAILLSDTVNETTNQLNGIINYAQILLDSDEKTLTEEDKDILQKIIENGGSIAQKWQNIT